MGLIQAVLSSEVPLVRRDIDLNAGASWFVSVADVDGDGRKDVIGAGFSHDQVSWWRNLLPSTTWPKVTVDAVSENPVYIYGADLEPDGDVDLFGVLESVQVRGYENENGIGTVWDGTQIGNAGYGQDMHYGDINRDGLLDAVCGWSNGISWYENPGNAWSFWTAHPISVIDSSSGVWVCDMDNDGDSDIVLSDSGSGLTWLENVDGFGASWTENDIDSAKAHCRVTTGDMDGDGDQDIVAAQEQNIGDVSWWENLDGQGDSWQHRIVVDSSVYIPKAVCTTDLDGDSDLDILISENNLYSNDFLYLENLNGDGTSWGYHCIENIGGSTGTHVDAADLDRDGDIDVVGCSLGRDDVMWWENKTLHRNAVMEGANFITDDSDSAYITTVTDIDGDGDFDIVAAVQGEDLVLWYENVSGDGSVWTDHEIESGFDNPLAVHTADIDRDGDEDVLSCSPTAGEIVWWENADSNGALWNRRDVTVSFPSPVDCRAVDLDQDGDFDILAASIMNDDVVWWENNDGEGGVWSMNSIDLNFDGPYSVRAGDIDDDGDIDVVATGYEADEIVWWENIGAAQMWSKHVIASGTINAYDLLLEDMDMNGSIDVVATVMGSTEVSWWENSAGTGMVWTKREVDTAFSAPKEVFAVDMDSDGDVDLLGASGGTEDSAAYWENVDRIGETWTKNSFPILTKTADSICSADLDGDSMTDVVIGGATYPALAWWKNVGGQYGADAEDVSCSSLLEETVSALLRITVSHNGRSGDAPIEIDRLSFLFEESAGDPLSEIEAENLFQKLYICRDEGSGDFETGLDLEVMAVEEFPLVNGEIELELSGYESAQIEATNAAVFYAVIHISANASAYSPSQFRMSYLSSRMVVKDVDYGLELKAESGSDCSTQIISITECLQQDYTIRADGSGDYPTIQEALNFACTGQTIFLEDGTYTGLGNISLNFLGKAVTVESISGDPESCVIDCENQHRGAVFISGESTDSELRGVTILNGFTGGSGGGILFDAGSSPAVTDVIIKQCASTGSGGGISCESGSSPVLNNCNLLNNSAEEKGGGLFCTGGSSPVIDGGTIGLNVADQSGGGVCCEEGSSPVFSDGAISSNSSGDKGGGLYSIDSSPALSTYFLGENHAAADGGGIYCENIGMTIDNCTLYMNSTESHGGGFAVQNSNLTVTQTHFLQNAAVGNGGAVTFNYSTAGCLMTECTIEDNQASNGGGVYAYGSQFEMDACSVLGNVQRGIYCYDSDAELTDCLLNDNYASSAGGALCADYSCNCTLTGCTISGNSSGGEGGGMYLKSSPSVIHNATITSNTAASSGGGIACRHDALNISMSDIQDNSSNQSGGGVFFFGGAGDKNIVDSTISGNFAAWHGGGLFVDSWNSEILRCTISSNTAELDGGGAYFSFACVRYKDSTISGNTALKGGGVRIYNGYGPPSFERCNIRENQSIGGDGGAVSIFNSSPKIVNCTITGNQSSEDGGAIECSSSSPEIINCTFVQNQCAALGGAVYAGDSSPVLVNAILWNNSSGTGENEIDPGSGNPTADYCNFSQASCPTGTACTSCLFNEPPNFIGGDPFDYHLQSGSGCIDAGTDDVATYPNLPDDDIDGETRPQEDSYDIGSDEYMPDATATPFNTPMPTIADTPASTPSQTPVPTNPPTAEPSLTPVPSTTPTATQTTVHAIPSSDIHGLVFLIIFLGLLLMFNKRWRMQQ